MRTEGRALHFFLLLLCRAADELRAGNMVVVHLIGWLTVTVVVVKSAYNLAHFVYTTILARLLGHGIQLGKCGPWAGNELKTFS